MPLNRLALLATFLSLLSASAFAQPAPATPSAPTTAPAGRVTEKLLYQIPEKSQVTDTLCAPDGQHVMCLEKQGEKFHVVVNGVRSPAMEWVVGKSLGFSEKGGQFTFQTQHDGLMYVAVGKAGPTWNATEQTGYYLVGRVVLSPDGTRYAYGAQKEKNGKMVFVADGKESEPVDEIHSSEVQFSPDGKRLAYRARAGEKPFYVVDGVRQPVFDSVAGFTFSPDGSRWGYMARNGADSLIVIDGVAGTPQALAAGITFSPDGKQYAYVVEPKGADGKPSGKYQLAHNAGQGEQLSPPCDQIGTIVFSPDSQRLAITSMADKKWTIVIDGKPAQSYEGIGAIQFSPDGKRLAAVVGKNKQQMLAIDGVDYPPVDLVGSAEFAPDGSRIAFVAVVGKERVLYSGDKRVGPATFFAYSPDSRHLGHSVLVGERKFWAFALDGVALNGQYDGFPPGARLVWDSPKSARIIAARDTGLYQLTISLP